MAESKKPPAEVAADVRPEAPAKPKEPLTVEELFAQSVVHLPQATPMRPAFERRMARASHDAASTLHGWNHHAHHEAQTVRLAKEDYDAALKALEPQTRFVNDDGSIGEAVPEKGPAKDDKRTVRTDVFPHEGALSEHHPIFGAKGSAMTDLNSKASARVSARVNGS